jgi:hypothetical protein
LGLSRRFRCAACAFDLPVDQGIEQSAGEFSRAEPNVLRSREHCGAGLKADLIRNNVFFNTCVYCHAELDFTTQ